MMPTPDYVKMINTARIVPWTSPTPSRTMDTEIISAALGKNRETPEIQAALKRLAENSYPAVPVPAAK